LVPPGISGAQRRSGGTFLEAGLAKVIAEDLCRRGPCLPVELQLVGKRDELEIVQARRLLLYAKLQEAMGGTWKWLP